MTPTPAASAVDAPIGTDLDAVTLDLRDPPPAVTAPGDDGDGPGPPAGRRPGRFRRHPLVAGLVLLVLLLVAYVGGTFLQVWTASRHDAARPAGAIVVLGAAQYNGRPSPALQDRLEHGLALYRAHLAPVVVVTGGRRAGDRYTEATVGYDFLRRNGVPDSAIRKEVQGRSTYESLASVSRFLRVEDIDDVVLVSGPATSKRLAGIARAVRLHAAISPPGGHPDLHALMRETAAVSVGRLIGYRRLERLDH